MGRKREAVKIGISRLECCGGWCRWRDKPGSLSCIAWAGPCHQRRRSSAGSEGFLCVFVVLFVFNESKKWAWVDTVLSRIEKYLIKRDHRTGRLRGKVLCECALLPCGGSWQPKPEKQALTGTSVGLAGSAPAAVGASAHQWILQTFTSFLPGQCLLTLPVQLASPVLAAPKLPTAKHDPWHEDLEEANKSGSGGERCR